MFEFEFWKKWQEEAFSNNYASRPMRSSIENVCGRLFSSSWGCPSEKQGQKTPLYFPRKIAAIQRFLTPSYVVLYFSFPLPFSGQILSRKVVNSLSKEVRCGSVEESLARGDLGIDDVPDDSSAERHHQTADEVAGRFGARRIVSLRCVLVLRDL